MRLKDTIHDRLGQNLLIFFFLILAIGMSQTKINTDWQEVMDNGQQFHLFFSSFLQPDWEYLPKLIKPIMDTLTIAVSGTFLGMILAVPAAFLGTFIVTQNHWISSVFRFIFGLLRTIPTLLLAAIFVAIIGIGQLTGVFTIAVFTFAMASQLIYGAIETIDLNPIESDQSIGANKFQIAVNAIWPQISHDVYSYGLYAFEVNVRASAILGYVGAGGIGVLLQTALGFFKYGRVSLIILAILFMVILTDLLSHYVREEVL